jgi:hypothetical protein
LTGQARLGYDRLEQLDGITGRVFDNNLLAANAADDLIPEMRSRHAQHLYKNGGHVFFSLDSNYNHEKVISLDVWEAVPATHPKDT